MGAFGLTDIPGHSMTTNKPKGGSTYQYLCSCGEELWIRQKQDGNANSWGKRDWKDHCDRVTTSHDFYVDVGTIQKTRVKWSIKVMSTEHPEFVKYQVPSTYWATWWKEKKQKHPGYQAFAVCIQKSGRSKWVVSRVMDSRDGALKSAADIVRKGGNNLEHVAELIHGDGTPVVEVVSVDICKATSQILNEADEAMRNGDLLLIMAKRRELQDVLNMGPLLQAKINELDGSVANTLLESATL